MPRVVQAVGRQLPTVRVCIQVQGSLFPFSVAIRNSTGSLRRRHVITNSFIS